MAEKRLRRVSLPTPAFYFVMASRALGAAATSFWLADRMRRRTRRKLAAGLAAVGALTTMPEAIALLWPRSGFWRHFE